LKGLEDLVGGLGPHVGPRVVVQGPDPVADVFVEGADAAVGAALQFLGGQLAEPAFDQVEPGTAGRGEVQDEPGVPGEPPLDRRGLVDGRVVQHHVQVQVGGDFTVEGGQEVLELDRPVPGRQSADDFAGAQVRRGVKA
jgi:hypothetical protein